MNALQKNTNKADVASWERDGVVVLRQFFSQERISQINELIDQLWRDRAALSADIVIDTHLQTAHSERRLFKSADNDARQHPYKINDLFLEIPIIRQMALDGALCHHLRDLLDGDPMLFNSLNFEYGSNQNDHRDTLFMPPRVPNKLVVSWIALEDISSSSGPVRYYPGSHKIPRFTFTDGKQNAIPGELAEFDRYMEEEIKKRGIEPVAFEAAAGDVLIWHSELLHGGMPTQDSTLTRKSLVSHYYRKQDYSHRFWQIKKQHAHGFYFKRPHLSPDPA